MTTTTPKAQTLAVLDPNQASGWMEVHKAGCAHLTRGVRGRARGANSWTLTATSLEDAAAEIGSDFINEGSMSIDEVISQVEWAPCVKLPAATPTATVTVLPTAAAIEAAVKTTKRTRKAAAVEVAAPEEEAPKAPRAPRPASERRNETTHPDGEAAVATLACPTCAARKAVRCTRHDGEHTNHVHSARMKAWEAKGSPAGTLPAKAAKAPAKAAAKKAAAK